MTAPDGVAQHRGRGPRRRSRRRSLHPIEKLRLTIIDKTGALAIAATLDRAMKFSEGLAAAKLDKFYGYVDRAGTWAISPRFAWVRPFSQGLDYVGEPGSRGAYIDHAGRVVCTSK